MLLILAQLLQMEHKRLTAVQVLTKMIVCQMFFAFLLLQAVLVPSVVDADHTKTCPDPEAEDYDECLCKECCVFDIMFKEWFLLLYCEDLTFGGWWTCAQHCPKGDPHG